MHEILHGNWKIGSIYFDLTFLVVVAIMENHDPLLQKQSKGRGEIRTGRSGGYGEMKYQC